MLRGFMGGYGVPVILPAPHLNSCLNAQPGSQLHPEVEPQPSQT